MLLVLFSTGLRASELTALQVADVDWDRGLIMVRRGKGGKFRLVSLGGKTERALDTYLNHPQRPDSATLFVTRQGQPFTYEGLLQVFRRLERWTGIHCNPHKWRHTAAIQYLRNGGKIEVLRAMLGHSTMDLTLHYARIAGVDLTAAHDTADPARSLRTRI